ncbi:MAG: 8-oxo-dGTP diphosphatase [Paraglaciecola sp.]|jgi:8-oxo-dGTP diphosphatase
MKLVDVAVGVIKRDQQIYISKRADGLHQGGKWEFPGGKQEAGETLPEALARELFEEVGIKVLKQQAFLLIEHDYGDKKVRLHVQLVEAFSGEPAHREDQIGMWVEIDRLQDFQFPAANGQIVQKLQNL